MTPGMERVKMVNLAAISLEKIELMRQAVGTAILKVWAQVGIPIGAIVMERRHIGIAAKDHGVVSRMGNPRRIASISSSFCPVSSKR